MSPLGFLITSTTNSREDKRNRDLTDTPRVSYKCLVLKVSLEPASSNLFQFSWYIGMTADKGVKGVEKDSSQLFVLGFLSQVVYEKLNKTFESQIH